MEVQRSQWMAVAVTDGWLADWLCEVLALGTENAQSVMQCHPGVWLHRLSARIVLCGRKRD